MAQVKMSDELIGATGGSGISCLGWTIYSCDEVEDDQTFNRYMWSGESELCPHFVPKNCDLNMCCFCANLQSYSIYN